VGYLITCREGEAQAEEQVNLPSLFTHELASTQELNCYRHGHFSLCVVVMYGNTYTRRHRARDVRRAAERAGRLIQQAAPDPAGSQA
jgi:hypothetical protein